MPIQLLRRKPLSAVVSAGEGGLRRSLGLKDLLVLGVGGVVGTGVFVLTGRAAAANAGPAVVLSFVISALAAALAGLCYAEMASMVPIAGSAYTYAYVTLGEIVAFMIGWDLILEYGVAASTVAVGWSGYVTSLLRHALHLHIPAEFVTAPLHFDAVRGTFSLTHAVVNLPAMLVLAAVTWMLRRGLQLSFRIMSFVVVLKLAVIVAFIGFAARFVRPANWHPFIPQNAGHFGHFGWSGVLQAATILFFAYGGFDAVSTAAAECRRPKRDIPLGMFGSLFVAVALYVGVSLVLTGVVPYAELSVADPMAAGMAATGQRWMELLIEAGAIFGLFSVMTVQIYGQTRILFAMADDSLLPRRLVSVHPAFGTPAVLTTWIGALAAVAAGLLPIELLGELTSVGTLFAFIIVALGVMVLRLRSPDAPRAFVVPGGAFVVPLASVAVSSLLLLTATPQSLVRLFAWMGCGLAVYFLYSRRNSKLA